MDYPLNGDPCSALFLVLVCCAVGARAVDHAPALKTAGVRLAFLCLLASIAARGFQDQPRDAEGWVAVVATSSLLTGLVLGIAWIVLGVSEVVVRLLVLGPLENLRANLAVAEHRRREDRERRRIEDERRLDRERLEREAPQREAARREYEIEKEGKAAEQRRREDARARALLAFSLHAPGLGERFTRATFDEYLRSFMGDEFPADAVERRGEDLLALVERLAREAKPAGRELSLERVMSWYQDEIRRIEGLDVPEAVKDFCRVGLNQRCHSLLNEHLREAQP